METENRVRLTDARVRKFPLMEPKKERVVWDADLPGFGLRIRHTSKSYIVQYRPVGASRETAAKRFKLGTPETIATVMEARRIARAALGRVAAGGDPVAERKEDQRRANATVAALLARYDEHLQRREYVTRTDVLSLLRRRLKPVMSREVSSLKGWELAELFEKLDRAGRLSAAASFRTKCNTS